jgi:hypothetical protein
VIQSLAIAFWAFCPKAGRGPAYRFTPCRDADIEIRREELVVNGVSYGPRNPSDNMLVDHGVVKIGRGK